MKKRIICLMISLLLASGAFAESRDPVRVSYLGPEGTYTEKASRFWFRNGEKLIPRETVQDAIADLPAGYADHVVIPQENTLGGPVVNDVDALIGEDHVYVVGEAILSISQTLMGLPGAALSSYPISRGVTGRRSVSGRNAYDKALKAQDQMAWVAAMNSIRHRAEEVILSELVFG